MYIQKLSGPKFGKRHEQLILFFLMVLVEFQNRGVLSIAIVAMTDPKSNPNIPVSMEMKLYLFKFLCTADLKSTENEC